MSQKISHDAVNNILHIDRGSNSIDPSQNIQHSILSTKLRGFIVNIADNDEQAEQLRQGIQTEINLMPLLANDEEEALNFVKSQGKIAISITPYEYLKFQVNLLEDLSRQENIQLINDSGIEAT